VERRPRLTVLAAVVSALVLLFSSPAWAQNKAVESAAKALQKKAMDEDYLNVDLDKAAERLNQAISKCGSDKCSANLRALLRRDLATVYMAGNKKDEALATMIDALKIDGSITLDANFRTKELDGIYAAAKKGGGGGSTAPSGGGTPSGDFTHTPASEQAVRTPLPIYVEYGGSEAVTKVVVKYKGFGMTEFKTLELKKVGTGWGANIPCVDIQQGDIAYYIQGFNANNDPVATGGDRNNPYKTSIAKTISGEAPHLPGQQPAAQCAETGDCPPDFPGCNKKVGVVDDNLKGEGEDCEEDSQCKSGTCKDDKCTKPKETEDTGGSGPKLRHFWIGAGLSLDLQFIPGANNVCLLNSNGFPGNSAYECVDSSGNDYPNRSSTKTMPVASAQNSSILVAQDDQVNGGMLLANLRFFVTFDYALNANLLLGARFGYTAMTYPGQAYKEFPPLIIEGRATYVIGDQPLVKKGLAPVIFLGGGAGNFSSHVGVVVEECDNAGNPNTPAGSVIHNGNPAKNTKGVGEACPSGSSETGHNAAAWRVAGPTFFDPGGGIRYAFSDRAALTLDVKLSLVFGNAFMFDPTPELVFQYGF
jgi:hypothetical protein